MAISALAATTAVSQAAMMLYNATGAGDLPAASGAAYGLDAGVHGQLIELTRAKCQQNSIPLPGGANLQGLCIWASVVAAKFMRHRAMHYTANVVRVKGAGTGDHYFVVASTGVDKVICDITCSQFGGPDFIVGTLAETRAASQTVQAMGQTLRHAYAAGAASTIFVV